MAIAYQPISRTTDFPLSPIPSLLYLVPPCGTLKPGETRRGGDRDFWEDLTILGYLCDSLEFHVHVGCLFGQEHRFLGCQFLVGGELLSPCRRAVDWVQHCSIPRKLTTIRSSLPSSLFSAISCVSWGSEGRPTVLPVMAPPLSTVPDCEFDWWEKMIPWPRDPNPTVQIRSRYQFG